LKDSDDVFFFTLIDFLLQVFFFGLLLFVVGQAGKAEDEERLRKERTQFDEVKKAAGVSNLAELTDYLTRLAPVKDLKGLADFITGAGGLDKAKETAKVVQDAGGPVKIKESLDKLRKLEEGTGRLPCIFTVVDGKRQAIPLATVVASETNIRFESNTPALTEVLSLLGRTFDSVRDLPLQEFRSAFGRLTQLKSDCRYTLRVIETTRFVDGRDAVSSAFLHSITRK